MQQYLYEWIQNITVYMILMMAVMQLLPSDEYKKYVRFYSGLLFILLLVTPLLKISNMQISIDKLYKSSEYLQEKKELKEYESYIQEEGDIWKEQP